MYNQNNFSGYVVKKLNFVKYLDILINDKLKWNIYIDYIKNVIQFVILSVYSEIFCHQN